MKQTQKSASKKGAQIAIVSGAAEMAAAAVAKVENATTPEPKGLKFGEVVHVPLKDIVTSPYNPRKDHSEEDLLELSDSIRQFGLLQPILLRPVGDKLEIVFGERRYLAHVYAERETIPAHIMQIADEEAEDMAITENLQRKDITPFEEAGAYLRLVELKRYGVDELAVKFGKNEKYIRSRLKLNDLIPEVAEMLNRETISLGITLEFAKYDPEIQREVHKSHFNEGHYNNWIGITVKEFSEKLIQKYMTRLDGYAFDKAECDVCPHNSVNEVLFRDCADCGNCRNRECLLAKNRQFLIDSVVAAVHNDPRLLIGSGWYNANKDVYEYFAEIGYEVVQMGYSHYYDSAQMPDQPDADDYDTPEELQEAMEEYKQELEGFKQESMELEHGVQEGTHRKYIVVEDNAVSYYYEEIKGDEEGVEYTKPATPAMALETQVRDLQKKDSRNLEIAGEKIVAETKDLYRSKDIPDAPLSPNEEKLLYYALLRHVDKKHYKALGVKDAKYGYLSDEQGLQIINSLTDRRKAIIIREFLKDYFRDNAHGRGLVSKLYIEMASEHFPDDHAVIRAKHEETFNKRHARLEERIGGLEREIALLAAGTECIEDAVIIDETAMPPFETGGDAVVEVIECEAVTVETIGIGNEIAVAGEVRIIGCETDPDADEGAAWEDEEPLMLPEGPAQEQIVPQELPAPTQGAGLIEQEIPDDDPETEGYSLTEQSAKGRKQKKTRTAA